MGSGASPQPPTLFTHTKWQFGHSGVILFGHILGSKLNRISTLNEAEGSFKNHCEVLLENFITFLLFYILLATRIWYSSLVIIKICAFLTFVLRFAGRAAKCWIPHSALMLRITYLLTRDLGIFLKLNLMYVIECSILCWTLSVNVYASSSTFLSFVAFGAVINTDSTAALASACCDRFQTDSEFY